MFRLIKQFIHRSFYLHPLHVVCVSHYQVDENVIFGTVGLTYGRNPGDMTGPRTEFYSFIRYKGRTSLLSTGLPICSEETMVHNYLNWYLAKWPT